MSQIYVLKDKADFKFVNGLNWGIWWKKFLNKTTEENFLEESVLELNDTELMVEHENY